MVVTPKIVEKQTFSSSTNLLGRQAAYQFEIFSPYSNLI